MAGCWAEVRQTGLNGMEAAVVIGRLGNSLLGSSHGLKCIVLDDGSSVTVSDPVELLKNLDIEHPVGQIVRDACQSHQKTYGTGTKTLLVLIGIWMKSAIRLREQGVPLRDIIQLMHGGIDIILGHLEEMKIPVILDHLIGNSKKIDVKCESREAWNTSWNVGAEGDPETGQVFNVTDENNIPENTSAQRKPFSTISQTVPAPGLDLSFQSTNSCDLDISSDLLDIHLKTEPQFSSLTERHDSDDDFADCFDGIPESHTNTPVTEDRGTKDVSEVFSEPTNCDSDIINKSQCEADTSVKLSLTLQMKNLPDLDDSWDDISWYFEPDTGIGQDKGQSDSLLRQVYGVGRNDLMRESSNVTAKMLIKDSNLLSFETQKDSDSANNFQNAGIVNFSVQDYSLGKTTRVDSFVDTKDSKESVGHMVKTVGERQRKLDDVLSKTKPMSLPRLKNCSRHFKTIESSVHCARLASDGGSTCRSLGKPNVTDCQNPKNYGFMGTHNSVVTAEKYSDENTELNSLCAKSSIGEGVNDSSFEETDGVPEKGMLRKVNQERQRKLKELLTQRKTVSLPKLQNCSRHFKTIESTIRSKLDAPRTGDKNDFFIKGQTDAYNNTPRQQHNLPNLPESVEQILDLSEENPSTLCRKSEETESSVSEKWTAVNQNVTGNSRGSSHHLITNPEEFSANVLSLNPSIGEMFLRCFPNMCGSKSGLSGNDLKPFPSAVPKHSPYSSGSADKPANMRNFKRGFTKDIQFPGVKTVEELAHRLGHGHNLAVRLVLEVFHHQYHRLPQGDEDVQKPQFDNNRLHTCATGQSAERSSCVREGLLLPMSHDLMIDRSEWRDRMALALLVNGNMSGNSRHTGYQTPIRSVTVFSRPGSKIGERWSQRVLKRLLELGVNILLVKGTVETDLKLLLESSDIVVVEHIQYRLLTVLASADVSKLVTYVESCCAEDLCYLNVSTLEMTDDNHKNFLVLKPVSARHMVWTVVLTHPCEEEARRREQQVRKCATCLSSILQGHGVVPGEGQSEFQLARLLSSDDFHPCPEDNIFTSLVFEELAAGFREYHSLVGRNTGKFLNTDTEDRSFCSCEHINESGKEVSSVNREQLKDFLISKEHTEVHRDIILDECCVKDSSHQSVNGSYLECMPCHMGIAKQLCPNCGLSQPSIRSGNRPYLDDFVSKAAAYRSAVETVCLILQCDYHISTGVSGHHATDAKNVL